jgi:hypothetical protein
MYAIIKDNRVICTCDYEPSIEDLRTRGETFVFSTGLSIGDTYESKEVD